MSQLIDTEALESFVQDDADMLAELSAVYAKVTPEGIKQLKEACESGNSETVGEVAARMERRFGCFAANSLVDLAAELQSLAKADQLAGNDELVDSVCQGALELIDELSSLLNEEN